MMAGIALASTKYRMLFSLQEDACKLKPRSSAGSAVVCHTTLKAKDKRTPFLAILKLDWIS